jgi:hypothetical protein
MSRYILIRRLRAPAFLLLVGVIALLAQANVLTWGQSWPLFLIVAGLLLLAERAALSAEGYPPYPGGPWQGASQGMYPGASNSGAGSSPAGQGGQPSGESSITPSESHDFENDRSGAQL